MEVMGLGGGGRLRLPGSGVREMGAGPRSGDEGPCIASMLTGASGHSVRAVVFQGGEGRGDPLGQKGTGDGFVQSPASRC